MLHGSIYSGASELNCNESKTKSRLPSVVCRGLLVVENGYGMCKRTKFFVHRVAEKRKPLPFVI